MAGEEEGGESLGGGNWSTEFDLLVMLMKMLIDVHVHDDKDDVHGDDDDDDNHHLSCAAGRVCLGRGASWERGGRPSGGGR